MTPLDLPPGEKWRHFELNGLGFRDFARVAPDEPLNPFKLARFANLLVLNFAEISGLSDKTKQHLLGSGSEEWSGGAASRPLPDGRRLVILNPNHGPTRTNATLMEEISHVFLGHTPTRLKVATRDHRGRALSRDYRKSDEEEAYASGAAALVPYRSLRKFVLRGDTSVQLAKHFRVSRELVEYRMKVTKLWKTYRDAHLQL